MVDDLLVWLGKGQGESKNHFGDTRPVSSSGATYARAAVDATSVKGSGNLPENYNYTRLITWPEEVWYTVLFGNEPRGVRSNPARCFSLLSVFSLRTRELPSKPLRISFGHSRTWPASMDGSEFNFIVRRDAITFFEWPSLRYKCHLFRCYTDAREFFFCVARAILNLITFFALK